MLPLVENYFTLQDFNKLNEVLDLRIFAAIANISIDELLDFFLSINPFYQHRSITTKSRYLSLSPTITPKNPKDPSQLASQELLGKISKWCNKVLQHKFDHKTTVEHLIRKLISKQHKIQDKEDKKNTETRILSTKDFTLTDLNKCKDNLSNNTLQIHQHLINY